MTPFHPDDDDDLDCLGKLRLHRLDVDRDLDLVAYQNPARFERLVPGESEIATVDRGRGAEPKTLSTPRIASAAFIVRLENDFARDIANRQLASDTVAVVVDALDAGASERDGGVLVDLEEIRRAQVGVTLLLARVDARRGDLGFDRRAREIRLVERDRAAHVGEAPADGGDHEVLHREADLGVCRIDVPDGPGAGRGVALEGGAHRWLRLRCCTVQCDNTYFGDSLASLEGLEE